MNGKGLGILLLVLFAASIPGVASEEDHLAWQTVTIKCREVTGPGPGPGPVACDAELEANGREYRTFVITAFGKAFPVAAGDLDTLAGFPLSSLRLTHEAGYPQTGGPTVHARLRRTRFSKMDGPISEELVISVTKAGLTVAKPRTIETPGD